MKLSHKLFCLLLSSILLLILIPSCKPKQKIIHSTLPIENKANIELFSDVLSKQLNYSTLTARLNVAVSTGTRTLSSKGTMKVVNNDAAQISLQPLFGMEMFRIYFDQDSLVFLDRMNKCYVKESYSQIKEKYPIGFDFDTLLSLFTNKLFLAGSSPAQPVDYESFSYSDNSNSYYLRSVDEISGIEYAFTINADDKIMFTHLMENNGKYSLIWEYNNFTPVGNTIFPTEMNIESALADKKLNLDLQFSDIVLNEPTTLSIQIPSGYSKITISDILKIVRNI
jgi:hypothetical protein